MMGAVAVTMDFRRAALSLRGVARAPWVRGLRTASLGIAALFAVYLLVANVILRTHLLRGWLNRHPGRLLVEYRSAWSLYPGHVTLRDLVVRHQDANITMQLDLERATLHLSLWALTTRTLLVDKVDADGGTFRLAHKSVSPEGNAGRMSAFPHVAGFTEPYAPAEPSKEDHRWAIELTNITSTMREVWTMEYRYRGTAFVTGGFRVRPEREISVFPSVMITHGGLFSFGERELIRGGEGRVEATLESFNPSVVEGIQVVRQLSGSVQQTGELVTLTSISETYFPGEKVHLEHGTGSIVIATRLEHGVFQPGGHVTYRSNDAAAQIGGVTVAGDLASVTSVEGPSERPTVSAEATIAKAVAYPTGGSAESHALDLRDVRASASFDRADTVTIGATKVTRAAAQVKSGRRSRRPGVRRRRPHPRRAGNV